MPATQVRLLGPLEVTIDGRSVAPGTRKQRALLAMLALRANTVVPVDELVEGLWGEEPPASATKLIQQYVSQLRRTLAGGDAEIVTREPGYELRVEPDAVDAIEFERLAEAATRNGENGDGGAAARRALSLWRGSPLPDLTAEPFAAAELRRLEELWLNVTEQALEDAIAAGAHDGVIARLDEIVVRHPLRERLHALRMRALYAAGRQAEALEAFRQARKVLVDEIGIEPGPELRRLHEAMLRQDPELAPPARARPAPRSEPQPQPGTAAGGRRRQRSRAFVIAAALAAVVGVAIFAISRLVAPDHLDRIDENAVGRIDGEDAALVEQYTVGREPRAIAAGDGSLWVADARDETVSRLDPEGNRVTTIPVGSDPAAVAFGEGAVWVAERGDNSVAQISPVTNKVTRRIPGVNAADALAAGHGALWVGSAVDKRVSRLRLGGGTDAISLGAPPSAIAVGAGAVWVTSEETGTLFRIGPRTAEVVQAIRVGNRPVAVAAGASGVWVVNRQDATVWRIDPATNSVTDTIKVARDPGAVALARSGVWIATADARVARIDPRSRRVTETVALGNPATALAADGGSVWVSTQSAPTNHRGGTVTMATEEFSHPVLEPGAYDTLAYSLLSLAYDGLVSYRRTGGTTFGPIVANLAESVPAPSADGRSYVFTLRRGIRYSDGQPVGPADFRASMQNLLATHGKALPNFFDVIVGARECVAEPERCDLSRGIVVDERQRTITIRLTRPDPDLLLKLANPLAYVAPATKPFGPDRRPPGTGPYRIDRFEQREGAEFSRNPHFRSWSADARPDGLPDRIRVVVGTPGPEQVGAVERGEADIVGLGDAFGASVPLEEITRLSTRYPERFHATATPSLFFLWMNVNEPPFDDVRVRRAVNFAIDRRLIADLEAGDPLALPACHHVAPGHPGFVPECEYTSGSRRTGVWNGPDETRAKALVADSGTAGQQVTVHVPEDKLRVGRYIVRVLDRLGYRARVRTYPHYGLYHEYAADTRHRVQIGTDGWAADFPTPADFTTPFTCGAFTEASITNTNLSGYCDRGFEQRIAAARGLRGKRADELWRSAYRHLSRTAPAAPLVNRRGAVFVSERLGNYQHHPLFGVLFDQAWVR